MNDCCDPDGSQQSALKPIDFRYQYSSSLKMINFAPMTNKQRKDLLKAQQGELDAVPMYNALAAVAKHERDKETFRQLAREEGRHASFFQAIRNLRLRESNM